MASALPLNACTLMLVHPWGLEDAVHSDVEQIRLINGCSNPSPAAHRLGDTTVAPHNPAAASIVDSPQTPCCSSSVGEELPRTARGSICNRQLLDGRRGLCTVDVPSDCAISHLAALVDGLYRCRVIDTVCLWLGSTPCTASCAELDEMVLRAMEFIPATVYNFLFPLRASACDGEAPHDGGDPVLCANRSFHQLLAHRNRILFRVNAIRRDKTTKPGFTSQDISQHVGELLYDALCASEGWRVDLLYYNVEFLVVHDGDCAHFGLCLHPPNVPRTGLDAVPMDGVARELLRQHISVEIASIHVDHGAEAAASTVTKYKGFVSRPGHFKHDLRCSKGDNAMHPAIASALTLYADVCCGDVVVDPMCGSGTILMESWLRLAQRTSGDENKQWVVLIGGDMRAEYARRTARNMAAMPGAVRVHRSLHRPIGAGPLPPAPQHTTSAVHRSLLEMAVPSNVVHGASNLEPFAWNPEAWAAFLHQNAEWCELHDDASNSPQQRGVGHRHPHQDDARLNRMVTSSSFQWDATRLPFPDASVDVVISDLPFGRRCGTHGINAKVYPQLLTEFHRVLRKSSADVRWSEPLQGGTTAEHEPSRWWCRARGVGRCVLITIEWKLMCRALQAVAAVSPFRTVREPFPIDMGGLHPYVFVLDAVALG